jgi:hypothetical protein
MMRLQRDWITPVTMGAFGLLAATGVLMFFHLDSGLNKPAHEWLSWVLLAGVAGHAVVNWPGLRRHLADRRGRLVLGVAGILLAASFLSVGRGGEGPPFVTSVHALADAPLPLLAQIAHTSPERVRARLAQAGHAPASDTDSVKSLVGDDLDEQMHLLGTLLKPTGG